MDGPAVILVVVTTPAPPPDALRLVTGLVAGGHAVRLVEAGPGRGALSAADDLPEETEDYLRAIADFDVKPEPIDDPALREALLASSSLMRIGDPARAGEPAVLAVSDALIRESAGEELIQLITDPGQVIRA